jgi:hypothetical protein
VSGARRLAGRWPSAGRSTRRRRFGRPARTGYSLERPGHDLVIGRIDEGQNAAPGYGRMLRRGLTLPLQARRPGHGGVELPRQQVHHLAECLPQRGFARGQVVRRSRHNTSMLRLAESALPGFGLEQIMNFAAGGSWHFGFHAQVDLAEMLTAGKEEAYLDGFWRLMSRDGLGATARAEYLRSYNAPGGMRGGFQHYSTLLTDGQAARAAVAEQGRLLMPVLVLNGEFGLPQAPLLDGARQLATDVRAGTIPGSSHTIGSDNPAWLAERLIGFFGPDIAASEDQGRPDASRG